MKQPELVGIHHVKYPVTDLGMSRAWYEQVFALTLMMEFRDEPDGPVRGIAFEPTGGVMIGLREHPHAAAGLSGFDPVSFAIADRDAADAWVERLDSLGIEHSPVIDASIGWLIVFHDPDGIEIHLYTLTAHGIDQTGRPGYGTIADPEGSER